MKKIEVNVREMESLVGFTALAVTIHQHCETLAQSCGECEEYMSSEDYRELMDHCLDLMNTTAGIKEFAQEAIGVASIRLLQKIMEHENGDSDTRD